MATEPSAGATSASCLEGGVEAQGVAPFIGGDSRQPAMDREPNAVTTADPGTRAYDRDVWQTLLYHHDKIRREVKRLPNGKKGKEDPKTDSV